MCSQIDTLFHLIHNDHFSHRGPMSISEKAGPKHGDLWLSFIVVITTSLYAKDVPDGMFQDLSVLYTG